MEQIKTKLFDREKDCFCGGKIKELVELHDSDQISKEIGWMKLGWRNQWVSSRYIACYLCGAQYGKPRFESVLNDDELREKLKWELALYEAKITREIVPSDIFPPPENLPVELSKLKHSDMVYVDENHPLALGVIKKHRVVRLNKTQSAEVYILSIDCLE